MLRNMGKVWFANPNRYIKYVIETGTVRLFWTRKTLDRYKIDPHGFAKLNCLGTQYEYLILEPYGVTHWREGRGQVATYPTWDYIDNKYSLLQELCEHPAGNDVVATQDLKVPAFQRPRLNQEHLICITNVPEMSTNLAKRFYMQLTDIIQEQPVNFILPMVTSYRLAFGLGFAGAGLDPFEQAKHGNIILPSGKKIYKPEDLRRFPMWTRIFGHSPADLERNIEARIAYNVASMLFAEENFLKLNNFRPNAQPVETHLPMAEAGLPQKLYVTTGAKRGPKPKLTGIDKVNCDTCSLANSCAYARDGAVCALPNSDGVSLSTFFNTRDSEKIVTGLGTLNGMLAKRLERKVNMEETLGEDDPEVLKLASTLFRQGSELAKLLNPDLRGGAKVQVNVGQHSGPVQVNSLTGNPTELMANIARALEAQGISREHQTPTMIENFIRAMGQDAKTKERADRAIESIANTVDAVSDSADNTEEQDAGGEYGVQDQDTRF